METILVLMHVDAEATLGRAALEALSAAAALKGSLSGSTLAVGLVGDRTAAAAAKIGACGADRWLAVEGAEFTQPRYGSDAAAAEALVAAAGATLVLAPGTSRWSRCLAGVAQRLDGRADTHVTSISVADGRVHVTRWFYRQRMEATLGRAQRPWFILVDPGCHEPWMGQPAPVTPEAVSATVSTRTGFLEYRAPAAGQQTIRPDAGLLFVAGAGWTKQQPDGKVHAPEAAALILDFITRTQSSLGSSKSLVDLGADRAQRVGRGRFGKLAVIVATGLCPVAAAD